MCSEKVFRIVAGAIFSGWMLAPRPAQAHTPHDHIEIFHVSPDYASDQTLFIAIRGNLLRSTNGGQTWQRIVRGLDTPERFTGITTAQSPAGDVLYLTARGDSTYKSFDGGTSWKRMAHVKEMSDFVSLHASGEVVLAIARTKGLFRTEAAETENWQKVLHGRNRITAVASPPDGEGPIVAGDDQGDLHLSEDKGITWIKLAAVPKSGGISAIALSRRFREDRTILIGTRNKGVLKSTDSGVSFSPSNIGLTDRNVTSLTMIPESGANAPVLVSTWQEGVFHSLDGGRSWEKRSVGLTKHPQADHRGLPHFTDLRAAKNAEGETMVFLASHDGLFRSADKGMRWREIRTLTVNVVLEVAMSPDYAESGAILANTYWRGCFLSRDRGETWESICANLARPPWRRDNKKIVRMNSVAFSPDYPADPTLYLGATNHLYATRNEGLTWKRFDLRPLLGDDDVYVDRMVFSSGFSSDRTLFAGGRVRRGKPRGWGVCRSTDGGKTWTLVLHQPGRHLQSLAISPDYPNDKTVFVAPATREGGEVLRTEDGGDTWVAASEGLEVPVDGAELAISPDYRNDKTVLAGSMAGLFKSVDGGRHWVKVPTPVFASRSFAEAVAISPDYANDRSILVCMKGQGLFMSRDAGESFHPVGAQLIEANKELSKMWYYLPGKAVGFSPGFAQDRTLFGFADFELFRSTDSGYNWETLPLREFVERPIGPGSVFYLTTAAPATGVLMLLWWLIGRRPRQQRGRQPRSRARRLSPFRSARKIMTPRIAAPKTTTR